jgi:hypothetical protein
MPRRRKAARLIGGGATNLHFLRMLSMTMQYYLIVQGWLCWQNFNPHRAVWGDAR